MTNIETSLQKLRFYIESENFQGYDPYDTLNSVIPFNKFGKWVQVLATQVQKRNPVNLRPLLGIKKGYNPKAMGLFLQAYSLLYRMQPTSETKEIMDFLFNWLCENYSRDYSGFAWGYNFAWASPAKVVEAYTPSIVVTAFVGKGLFEYYQTTGNQKALEVLQDSCKFILKDLERTETADGICFSYTPVMKDCCYNASMLGAEILTKVYSKTGDKDYLNLAQEAVDFVVAHQQENGVWNYSLDPETGKERVQIDFHQGFILDSLYDFIKYSGTKEGKYNKSLTAGAEFYRKQQFFEEGRSKWRLPREWPVEIHNQAQGILTFTKLAELDPSYLEYAQKIAAWTINNMQDRKGFFYYRSYRLYKNKISFMRWAQAWMLLVLAELLYHLNQN